jgi:hypothetical protein
MYEIIKQRRLVLVNMACVKTEAATEGAACEGMFNERPSRSHSAMSDSAL